VLPSPDRESALLAGSSEARERLVDALLRVARTPRTTVLVRGERGAGKRTAAEHLHAFSGRRVGPCTLLRAGVELAPGALEEAVRRTQGGTLVLLGVEGLPSAAQAVLQAELVEPTADLRVVVTTSQDLGALVAAGRLREDLLYRLNVLSLCVPALRERAADLPAVTAAMLAELGRESGLQGRLEPDALEALGAHAFPGNLRELRGVLAAALARAGGGQLRAADLALPGAPRAAASAGDGDLTLRGAEERQIRRVLALTGGNRSRAARALGINRQTLYNKLAALGADVGPSAR